MLVMFTGIVQGTARIAVLNSRPGLASFTLALPPGFDVELAIGASVSINGVCLTVTSRPAADQASFDVMQQSLALTTLGAFKVGDAVNVERAAKDGAEIGGHPLSDNNRVLRLAVPAPWMRYVFAKGYIAVNGASLTVAECGKNADASGWFEVWLIPETLRMTTFGALQEGDAVNIEIDRSTQVVVDTVRDAVQERLGKLLPALEAFARERGIALLD
jgi:riboflavin synthase